MHVGLAIYGDLEQTSGGYRYDRKLVSHLEARGDTVTVISLPRESDPDRPLEGVRDRLDQPYDVLIQDELCYPDLTAVNPHLERPGLIVALVHLLEAPHPGTTASDDSRRTVDYERRYLESVDAAIATSEYTRSKTADLAAMPTAVVHPAGRREGAALEAELVRTRAREKPFRVAFVGNLLPRKNLPALLRALADVDAAWELTVVGGETDPAEAGRARTHATDLEIADSVEFAGQVDTDTLESILERAHVLAVPASYEGFGMVYLEAMEFGVAPIASAVGGASDIVEDGENGYLVDPDDPTAIAECLDGLVADRKRLASLGCRALETANTHPTWTESMEAFRETLQTWLADSSVGPRDE